VFLLKLQKPWALIAAMLLMAQTRWSHRNKNNFRKYESREWNSVTV